MPEATQAPRRRPAFSPAVVVLLERQESAVSIGDACGVSRQIISYQLTGERPMRQSTLDAITELTDRRVARAVRIRAAGSFAARHPDLDDDAAFIDDTLIGAAS